MSCIVQMCSSAKTPQNSLKDRPFRRSGLTLVELLVAATITLLLVYGLAQTFAVVSGTVTSSRAAVEMLGQLRGVAHQLQRDLEGITVPVRPWPRPEAALGYF